MAEVGSRRVVRERYVAKLPKELSVHKHETVTVIDLSGQWWFAVNAKGQNGLVPSNSLYPLGEGPAPAPAPRRIITKAVYDCDAADTDELSFKKGDILVVVDEYDDGWWKGYRGTELGLFPSNYVEEVGVAGTEDPAQANGPSLNITARAKYRYQATAIRKDELSFEEGDEVVVMEKEADGWWKGRCGTRIGWFPFSYVEEVGVSEATPEKSLFSQREKFPFGVRANYPFNSKDPEELEFQKGDLLDIIDKSEDDPDWWIARNANGEKGLIPRNYVEIVKDAEPVYVLDEDKSKGKLQCVCTYIHTIHVTLGELALLLVLSHGRHGYEANQE